MATLRVSHSDSTQGQLRTLCGRLAGPWVDAVREYWRYARRVARRARAVVDLHTGSNEFAAGALHFSKQLFAGPVDDSNLENQYLLANLSKQKKAHR